jgi:hypothetical protein
MAKLAAKMEDLRRQEEEEVRRAAEEAEARRWRWRCQRWCVRGKYTVNSVDLTNLFFQM